MSNNELSAHIAAGSQFDGTAGKGLFSFNDRSGVDVRRISFEGGAEAKNYTISVVDEYGRHKSGVHALVATTAATIDLVWQDGFPIGPNEALKVVTTGASSEMWVRVISRDLKG